MRQLVMLNAPSKNNTALLVEMRRPRLCCSYRLCCRSALMRLCPACMLSMLPVWQQCHRLEPRETQSRAWKPRERLGVAVWLQTNVRERRGNVKKMEGAPLALAWRWFGSFKKLKTSQSNFKRWKRVAKIQKKENVWSSCIHFVSNLNVNFVFCVCDLFTRHDS